MPPITVTTAVEKKLFNYYAIRIGGMIILRRTTGKLSIIKSTLYSKSTPFALEQITYIGGKVIGTISYAEWLKRVSFVGSRLNNNNCTKVAREIIRSLRPFLQKGE